MAVYYRKKPYTRKPPPGVTVSNRKNLLQHLAWGVFAREGAGIPRDDGKNRLIATATGTTGWLQGAMDFNNGRYTFGSSALVDTGRPFTIAARYKIHSYINAYPTICTVAVGTGTSPIHLFMSSSSLWTGGFGSQHASWADGCSRNVIPTVNQWYDIVAVYNGQGATTLSNYYLFEDGIKTTLTATNFGAASNTTSIAATSTGTYPMDGQIEYVVLLDGYAATNADARRWQNNKIYSDFFTRKLPTFYSLPAAASSVSVYYRRQPYTRKPPPGVRPNLGHPFLRKASVATYTTEGAGVPKNIITQYTDLTFTGSISWDRGMPRNGAAEYYEVDWASPAAMPLITNNMMTVAWCGQLDGAPSLSAGLFGKRDWGSGNYPWLLNLSTTSDGVWYVGDGVQASGLTTLYDTMTDGKYHRLVITCDSSNWYIYLDGVQIHTFSHTRSFNDDTAADLWVHVDGFSGSYTADGLLDVFVYAPNQYWPAALAKEWAENPWAPFTRKLPIFYSLPAASTLKMYWVKRRATRKPTGLF